MQDVPFPEYLRLPEAEAGARPAERAPTIRASAYFTSREWFRLLAETCLAKGETPLVQRIADEAGGFLEVPLVRLEREPARSRGYELHALANYYSSYYRPRGLTADAAGREAARAWARALGEAARPPDRVLLRALDEDDGTLGLLEDALRATAFRVERFPDFGNWYLPSAGLDFEAYWSGRSSRLRNTVKRKAKALERDAGIAYRCLARPDEAEAAIAAYSAVHARAWQPDEPHAGFIPELIRRGLAAGSLRLWLLEAEGRPIAAQIWTQAGGEATVFKLLYDADWKARSPGTLLTWRAMRSALEAAEFARIDFGRGDDDYKREWTGERCQRWGLVAYSRRTLAGNLLALRNLGPRYLKGASAFFTQIVTSKERS